MRDDVRDLLLPALRRAAARLADDEPDRPLKKHREHDDLRARLVDELVAVAAERGLDPKLKTEHPFQAVEWPSGAGVDLGIRGLPGLAPVFCELKWGETASKLGECSWDLAKMGLAVAKGACSTALLIAGSSTKRWKQPGLEGPELFATGELGLDHIRRPLYLQKYWAYYAREGQPQPNKLPAAYELTQLVSAPMRQDTEDWQLRCVEVRPVGELVPVEPLPVE